MQQPFDEATQRYVPVVNGQAGVVSVEDIKSRTGPSRRLQRSGKLPDDHVDERHGLRGVSVSDASNATAFLAHFAFLPVGLRSTFSRRQRNRVAGGGPAFSSSPSLPSEVRPRSVSVRPSATLAGDDFSEMSRAVAIPACRPDDPDPPRPEDAVAAVALQPDSAG